MIHMDTAKIKIVIKHARDENVYQREIKACISPVHMVICGLISSHCCCK